LRPSAMQEVRDRGLLFARTGRVDDAILDLERYLEATPDPPDGERVKILLEELGKE
ncbi:MAG: tetratricopeptide repeat protein, partial [Longimicrobiales bacterium]